MPMDCTYRLRIPHVAGQLAKVSTRIFEYGGLIGDVSTIAIARHEAIREITIELRDKEHADALALATRRARGRQRGLVPRRAFIAHDGGKIEMVGRDPIKTNQDVRDVYTPASRGSRPRSPSIRSSRAGSR